MDVDVRCAGSGPVVSDSDSLSEPDAAGRRGYERVISGPEYVDPGVDARAPLPNQHFARRDSLAVGPFHPQPLAVGITTERGGAACFGVGHGG